MKVAIVYNRDSKNVINLFGLPNREKIGRKTIKRLTDALKDGGHQVIALEGDKDLVDRLEEFMPRVVHGERPGLVFNVSYGIQGQARYTHVPSILEMVGIPYVASGPLAHTLALDKVVTKIILKQHGLPTPEFAVLETPDTELPPLPYPMVVKPKNEAVSFGLAIVNDEQELREKAKVIFDKFGQAVLTEQYIEGREINVGILGNNPPEAFPPVELKFGTGGPAIYTYEDKTGRSGREIGFECPAPIGEALSAKAQDVAKRAFQALGIADCARVDMRLDAAGNLYILELNSLPSLGEHGSYLVGAAAVGLDFTKFVNRLVAVASARYFGTPSPPSIEPRTADPAARVFGFVTERREAIERSLKQWVETSSRTGDVIGLEGAAERAAETYRELGMTPVEAFAHPHDGIFYQTGAGHAGGTLLVAQLDVPAALDVPPQPFRREPEWLRGEGIGRSRAPLVAIEYALRALRHVRRLRTLRLGVLLYGDEGVGARGSAPVIAKAMKSAKQVLVLRPGTLDNGIFAQRRGHRRLELRVRGEPVRPGRPTRRRSLLQWTWNVVSEIERLGSTTDRVTVSTMHVRTERHPMMLPHRIRAELWVTYLDPKRADKLEADARALLKDARHEAELVVQGDRPPKRKRDVDATLTRALKGVAKEWKIPLRVESSTWPSVAGLAPAKVPCVCGVGPVTRDPGTPQEAVQRISLVQRTLLLAEFLTAGTGKGK